MFLGLAFPDARRYWVTGIYISNALARGTSYGAACVFAFRACVRLSAAGPGCSRICLSRFSSKFRSISTSRALSNGVEPSLTGPP